MDDPEQLPLARCTDGTIALGNLSVALEGMTIDPRRERHDEGSRVWTGEWVVSGADPAELSLRILNSLAAQGLQSGGTFPPPPSGIQTWRSEASTAERLVKVYATREVDHVSLTVVLILVDALVRA